MAGHWYKSVWDTPVPHPTPRMLLNMEFPTKDNLRGVLVKTPYRYLSWYEIVRLMQSAFDEMGRGTREGDQYLMELYDYAKRLVEKRLTERLGDQPYARRV